MIRLLKLSGLTKAGGGTESKPISNVVHTAVEAVGVHIAVRALDTSVSVACLLLLGVGVGVAIRVVAELILSMVLRGMDSSRHSLHAGSGSISDWSWLSNDWGGSNSWGNSSDSSNSWSSVCADGWGSDGWGKS